MKWKLAKKIGVVLHGGGAHSCHVNCRKVDGSIVRSVLECPREMAPEQQEDEGSTSQW